MIRTYIFTTLISIAFLVPNSFGQGIEDAAYLVTVDNTIEGYDKFGNRVASVEIEYPNAEQMYRLRPFGEQARDLVQLDSGNIAVYNGKFRPYLSIFDSDQFGWVHHRYPGWNTSSSGSSGGPAISKLVN